MAEENVEVVLRAAEAWNRGELELALGLVDPEVEVEVALDSPADGTYRGHEGVTQFLTEFWSQFETYRPNASRRETRSSWPCGTSAPARAAGPPSRCRAGRCAPSAAGESSGGAT